jgi:hypothetical protein
MVGTEQPVGTGRTVRTGRTARAIPAQARGPIPRMRGRAGGLGMEEEINAEGPTARPHITYPVW